MINKLISGGQTGIDRIALEFAKKLFIETGGYAPKGYLTEKGLDITLKEFNLIETDSSDYRIRTSLNVEHSTGTIWYGTLNSPGYYLTKKLCTDMNRPFIENPNINSFQHFIKRFGINILNIAGNRSSKLSEEDVKYYTELIGNSLYFVNYHKIYKK